MADKKLIVSLPEDVHRKVKIVAASRGQSMRQLIIEVLDNMILGTLIRQEAPSLRGKKVPWN